MRQTINALDDAIRALNHVLAIADQTTLVEHRRNCQRCTLEALYQQRKRDQLADLTRHLHKKTRFHHIVARDLAEKAHNSVG